jgi:hypothetical protein
VYQLSKPSFQLPTPPPWTFDLIKQKGLQVCTLDNSNTQELSAEELRQKRHENPSDVIGSYNAEYKTHQYNQIYAIVSAIVSAACVVTLYLTKKLGNSVGNEMTLDQRFKHNLKAAYERCQNSRGDLNEDSRQFIRLVNLCGKFIESQCTKENKYEGVLQSAGLLYEIQNMMSIPNEEHEENRLFLQANLLNAIYNRCQRNSPDTLFDIASSPAFRSGMVIAMASILHSELAKQIIASEMLYDREAIDELVDNMLRPRWFARIELDNYEYGPFQDFFDYLKTATQISGAVNTIWNELMTRIQNSSLRPLLPTVQQIGFLRGDELFLRYDIHSHSSLDRLYTQYAHSNPPVGDKKRPHFVTDIEDFIGEFIYNSAVLIRRNGFDTQREIFDNTIDDLLNFSSQMRIQTGNRTLIAIATLATIATVYYGYAMYQFSNPGCNQNSTVCKIQ